MTGRYKPTMKHLLLAVALLSGAAQAQQPTVHLRNVGSPNPIRVWTEKSVEYISATDLFTALQANVSPLDADNKLETRLLRHRLVFQLGNNFCSIDGHLYNLVQQPIFHIDDLYLPLQPAIYLLSDVLDRSLIYDKPRRAIVAIGRFHNIVGLTLEEKVNGDLLEIILSRRLEYDIFVSEGNWINVTLPGGEVDTDLVNSMRPSPKVIKVSAFQFDNSAQISIQMRQTVGRYHSSIATDPHRIQIAIEREEFSISLGDSGSLLPGPVPDSIDVIVIDPGHGGEHDGAIGQNGLREKQVVLDIALRLEKLLLNTGRFKVVLTRREDVTVGLPERARIANDVKGDLFVSIHCNSSDDRRAAGSETFFLAAAKNDEARITELLENSDFHIDLPSSSNRERDELDFIIMDVLQTEYLTQSQQLAEMIQSELKRRLNIRSRGINQAGFAVLNHVQMPSALVEVAFISNRVEERLLEQTDFRQAAADGIYHGLMKFVESYERQARVNAGSQ